MIKMKLFSTIFILLLSFSLIAQEHNKEGQLFQDIVYLKDGSIFRGKILEYKPAQLLIIETWSGQQLKFEGNVVKRVRQELISSKSGKKEKSYEFREKGIFNSTDISVNGSENDWGRVKVGAAIANVTGYQFNRFIGVGVGLGFDTYELLDSDQFIPIFVEARGYLLEKNATPMFRYQVGYGIGLKDLERDLFKSEGGFYSYPAVGFRFGGKTGGNTTLDLGYKVQMSKQHFRIWEGIEVRSITYQRMTLRFGVQF